jgi:FkbM family methyltransferase
MLFNKLPQNVSEFYTVLLTESINSLKLNTYLDNFDKSRFNSDGEDHSLKFNVQDRAYYFNWLFNFHPHLFDAYQVLEDDHSKVLYLYLICFRLAGHHSVRIPLDWVHKESAYLDFIKTQGVPKESSLNIPGMLGNLKHYNFEFDGNRYILDCTSGLEYYLFRRQYFYSKNGISIAPKSGDYVIDAGACMGDTALVFSNAVGSAGKVFAFDPVFEHLEIMKHNILNFQYNNVFAIPYGVSNIEVNCEPLVINSYNPGFRANTQNVPLCSIDAFVIKNDVPKVDFIKMDIEGSELDAITGAKESIQKFKPQLAISLYHKPNDIFELIKLIKTNFPFYKIYIDHYTIHQEETVMYCSI